MESQFSQRRGTVKIVAIMTVVLLLVGWFSMSSAGVEKQSRENAVRAPFDEENRITSCQEKLSGILNQLDASSKMDSITRVFPLSPNVQIVVPSEIGQDNVNENNVGNLLKQDHKVAVSGAVMYFLYPNNMVVVGDASSCTIDGVYFPTKTGQVHPSIRQNTLKYKVIAQDKKKKKPKGCPSSGEGGICGLRKFSTEKLGCCKKGLECGDFSKMWNINKKMNRPGTCCRADSWKRKPKACEWTEPCSRGSHAHVLLGCKDCRPGSYMPYPSLKKDCIPASPGYYVPGRGATKQLECPPHQYQNYARSRACKPCVGGTVQNGRTVCARGSKPKMTGRCKTSKNLSQGKPAYSSSVAYGGVASRAVDGNKNPNWRGRSCTHTRSESFPYLWVDLKGKKSVCSVSITNRRDCCSNRLRDFIVFVTDTRPRGKGFPLYNRLGSSICVRQRAPLGRGETRTFACKKRGRYVGIILQTRLYSPKPLTVCEFVVMGY